MRRVPLTPIPPGASVADKLDWCIKAIQQISHASNIPEPERPGLATHLADTTAAHAASAISFTPAGSIAATNAQAAIEELDTEKQPLDADLTAIAALSTTAAGRSILTFADPDADRIAFWDDSESAMAALGLSGLTITDTTLSVDAATTDAAGIVEEATDAEVRAATDGKFLHAGHIESASAEVNLTDAATVALDWDAGIYFRLDITQNRVLGNPTNGQPGTWRVLFLQSDAGPDTLTFGNQYFGPAVGSPPTVEDGVTEYLLAIFCGASNWFVVTAIEVPL